MHNEKNESHKDNTNEHYLQGAESVEIPLRVLIIEDSEDDTLLLMHQLERAGYKPDFKRVETKTAMLDAIENQSWDIIISDYKLPGFSGLAALKLYKEKGLDIPFIIVSGTIGDEIAAEAMISGANDYVMKSNLSRLVPAIQRELKEAESRIKRKKAEDALVESEAKYRDIFENATEGIFQTTPQGRYISVNPSFAKMFGFDSPQDMIENVTDIGRQLYVDPEDRERLKRMLLEKGSVEGFEVELLRKDKSRFWVSINVHAVFGPEGNMLYLEGTNEDITKRKEAENALKKSEKDYRSIIDNALNGIFRTTKDGKFLMANRAFYNMLGYESFEDMAASITDITHQLYVNPHDRQYIINQLEKEGIVRKYEAQFYKKDKSKIWVSVNMREILDEKGYFLYYEGIDEDITSRKLAEESLGLTIEKLKKALLGTVHAMSLTVETRDPYTAGHQRRVSNLACSIAKEMGLPDDTIDNIRMAGIIHDIGKISVPAEILVKPGKINELEMSLIRTHPQAGYDILKDVGLPYPIAEIVLQHHERLDGSGYPNGLKDEQIILEAKIISVADVIEAIASHRPHRPGYGIDVALEEIVGKKGILYDKDVVEACVKLFKEKGFSFE